MEDISKSINEITTNESTSLEDLNSIMKFELIKQEIYKSFLKKKILHVICRQNNLNNTMLIQLIYKKNSDLNPLTYDLVFSITIDHEFPSSIPVIKSLTQFSYPTIYDNRNLIFSIINHNWTNKNSAKKISDMKQLIGPIEEIIIRIPKFVERLIENTNNKILVYYGDYKIDNIYDMNEFLSNTDLDFYKVNQHIKAKKEKNRQKKERYVIMTDIYFLLFDAVPASKNLAKLLFWGDIRQIVTCKGSSLSSDPYNETLLLEWKSNNKIIQFEMSFLNSNIKDFLDKSTRKILRLREQYKIFQDDITKPAEEEIISKLKDVNISTSNIDKLMALVKYKEDLLEKQHSINIVRELMSLYQKIIEILSAKGDTDFGIYLAKLHTMLTDKTIQLELEKENMITNATSKQIFELSSSYQINDQHDEPIYSDRY